MILAKLGYKKPLNHREVCDQYSKKKIEILKAKHRKEGKLNINKEFYDELFEDYQKTLTE